MTTKSTKTKKTAKAKAARQRSKKPPAPVAPPTPPTIRDRFWPNGMEMPICTASDIVLSYQRLDGRAFDRKVLRQSALVQVSARGANFYESDCTEACFAGSDLSNANFQRACLRNADLTRCLTFQTDFSRADLDGAIVSADFPIPETYVADKLTTQVIPCLKLRRRTIHDDPTVSKQVEVDAAKTREARVDYLEALRAQGFAFIHEMKLLGGGDVQVLYRTAPGVDTMRNLVRIHWAYVQKLVKGGRLKEDERGDFLSLRKRVAREFPTVTASLLMREEPVHRLVAALEAEAEEVAAAASAETSADTTKTETKTP
jgi:hypothetical protein